MKETQSELYAANTQLAALLASREEELRRATNAALTAAEGEARRIGQDIHDSLCRIIREAIANAIKHAKARHIWIDMVHKDHRLMVSVSNDGTPLVDVAQRHDSLGMRQIRMRANLLGAVLDLNLNDGSGWTLLDQHPRVAGLCHARPRPG